ncbi:hypothetical protein TI39_contig371g00013 [Zymoseptoria brevis]|uniref:Uncharacterized protein n=1 Tax=Zymoseptoria brevis TaxID=1047168 RepID=A0A0F4GQ34_9PEZI|nr:hypothetical protein TI39_contig371g00013 [Zymoseptoria brevis]
MKAGNSPALGGRIWRRRRKESARREGGRKKKEKEEKEKEKEKEEEEEQGEKVLASNEAKVKVEAVLEVTLQSVDGHEGDEDEVLVKKGGGGWLVRRGDEEEGERLLLATPGKMKLWLVGTDADQSVLKREKETEGEIVLAELSLVTARVWSERERDRWERYEAEKGEGYGGWDLRGDDGHDDNDNDKRR